MIPVSESFKKAIKNANRNIYGYVDIKYQNEDFNRSVTQLPLKADIVSARGIIGGDKTLDKYATLENNYTLLDGSFMVWNENIVLENGYISENTFEDINDNTIIITNNSTSLKTKGVSVYFKENLPFDFTVTFTDTDNNEIVDNITNNQSYVYQYIFEEEIELSTMEITISSIEFPKNRLRIAYIDFNLSDFYENEELVNFDVTEELSLLMENLPINTCSIKLNNYPDSHGGNKFDPINPQGIVKYLDNKVTIEPYIGVFTEENGAEYVPMGLFYLDDWSSDYDGNVTLNGKSLLNKLKDKDMIWNSSMFSDTVTTQELEPMIETSANVSCSFPQYSMYLSNWTNMNTNLFDYLNYISPCLLYNNRPNIIGNDEYRKLRVNRYNTLVIDDIPTQSSDSISRRELIYDVDYITKTPIQNVQANYTVYATDYNTTTETIVNTTYTLTQEETYIWFKVDKNIASLNSLSRTVISGSANITLIGYSMRLIHAKITGTVGSIIQITCSAQIPNSSSQQSYNAVFTNKNVPTGDTLTLNFGQSEVPNFDSIMNVFFVLDKKYKVNAETIGDPSLEIGDMIRIQTRYKDIADGYKDIIITKQKFTFDGGLKCSLEGAGD